MALLSHTEISVIESRWGDSGNTSVRSIFDIIGDIFCGNPHSYTYDMFTDRNSLGRILDRVCRDGVTRYAYIASHGDENGIAPHDDETISRTAFRNRISSANKNGQLKGVFLGSCYAATEKYCEFLLHSSTNLKWIAGYEKGINWIDSSSVDLMFWNRFLRRKAYFRKKRRIFTEASLVEDVAHRLSRFVPGARKSMGLNVYIRRGRKVVPLFG